MAQIPNSVGIKSGRFPLMRMTLSANQGQSMALNAGWTPANYNHNTARSCTATFIPSDGTIKIREGRGDPNQKITPKNPQVAIDIPLDDYTVNRCEIQNGEFQFKITLKQDRSFRIITQGGQQDVTRGLFLGSRAQDLAASRSLAIAIPNVNDRKHNPDVFSLEIITSTVYGEYALDPAKLIDEYISGLKDAVQEESKAAEEKKNGLGRENVSAQLEYLPEMKGRLYVKLTPPANTPPWELETRTSIFIEGGGLFAEEPQPAPGSRSGGWLATVVDRDNEICAVIENPTNHFNAQTIDRLVKAEPVNVKVTVDLTDPETDKALRALHFLQLALHRERRNDTSPIEDFPTSFHVPLMPIYLQQLAWSDRVVPGFATVNNVNPLAAERRQAIGLEENSHHQAVNKALYNNRGIALIKGPPATGKTTLVAKIVVIVLEYGNKIPGNIVLAAHSNEAVRVATRRICNMISDKGRDPMVLVCLVLSRTQSEFFRQSENEFGTLEQITLDAHIRRILDAEPNSYEAYRAGMKAIETNGRIENQELQKQYDAQRQGLIGQVKNKCLVWCTTLAMCHTRHEVFGRDPKPFDCKLAIIDEASQAPDPALAHFDLTINPRRKVLVGDPNQLSPFTISAAAQTAYGNKSMFGRLWEKRPVSAPAETLDVQYRTAGNIYSGTNFHYNNVVKNHLSTVNRTAEMDLRAALGRITFKEVNSGKVHKFSSNLHLLNMRNSGSRQVGATKTWVNDMEATFVKQFVAALRATGRPAADLMALSPYNGQHNVLLPLAKQYPGLQVRKIDSSQGDEAEVIIFTMTRTIGQSLGFLNNRRRQNVGTSRARNGYFGLCNYNLMMTGEVWKGWFNALQAQNPNMKIDFDGPVEFFVNGQQVQLPTAQPAQTTQPARPAQPAQQPAQASGSGSHSRGPSIIQPPGGLARSTSQGNNLGGGHSRTTSQASSRGGHSRNASQASSRGGPQQSGGMPRSSSIQHLNLQQQTPLERLRSSSLATRSAQASSSSAASGFPPSATQMDNAARARIYGLPPYLLPTGTYFLSVLTMARLNGDQRGYQNFENQLRTTSNLDAATVQDVIRVAIADSRR